MTRECETHSPTTRQQRRIECELEQLEERKADPLVVLNVIDAAIDYFWKVSIGRIWR